MKVRIKIAYPDYHRFLEYDPLNFPRTVPDNFVHFGDDGIPPDAIELSA